ncbi:hypothetical protein GCM10009676_04720 [Prauserella halophila]|uniref:Uncharacterized protein n=1 Tax=Prauserella halophila TaxID=185641 RepID=A0ABN1VWS5_9PSEU|nr:hypothetical protein [Prauserella halophila]MCP2237481.1 hypothetical protein [Prauserella halophila]
MTSVLTVAASVAILIHRELDDDYVGLWVLPWHIRRALPDASDDQVRTVATAVLEALVAGDTALGTLDEYTGSFEPWVTGETVGYAMSAWRALGRDPNLGEVAWLARTS